jgi:hypothetical protein
MTAILGILLAAFLQSPAPAFDTVARDDSSGIEEPRQLAVRSAGEWSRLWREHDGSRPAPRVDFATRTVVAVFLGTRPSAGYAVEITGTRADGADLVVQWSERRPEKGMVTAQILTSPAHIVTVPKVAGTVRFEKAGQ